MISFMTTRNVIAPFLEASELSHRYHGEHGLLSVVASVPLYCSKFIAKISTCCDSTTTSRFGFLNPAHPYGIYLYVGVPSFCLSLHRACLLFNSPVHLFLYLSSLPGVNIRRFHQFLPAIFCLTFFTLDPLFSLYIPHPGPSKRTKRPRR